VRAADEDRARMWHRTGTTIGGRYRLENRIGSGAMAFLWQAVDTRLGLRVAVKTMSPSFADSLSMWRRFEREATITAKMFSDHVVSVRDYGIDGVPYIVMELLEGEDVRRLLTHGRRLTSAQVTQLVRQAARGLGCAHRAGVVHRDVKPANLFVCALDGGVHVKLLDFGVAKLTRWPDDDDGGDEGMWTQVGQLLGTPHFMSPEQALGEADVDHRSDLWSLAMIAFRAATGSLAVTGSSVAQTVLNVVRGRIRTVRDVAPELPVSLDAFFDKALSRDPAARFQSADELAAAFMRAYAQPRDLEAAAYR
jgi:serine/threonine-protein kinase